MTIIKFIATDPLAMLCLGIFIGGASVAIGAVFGIWATVRRRK
jgi:hypothetical protein